MKKNEKILVGIALALGIICIFQNFYCLSQKKIYEKDMEELEIQIESSYPEIYDYLDSVTYETFTELVNKEETIFYIGRPTCGDCNLFEPALIELIDSDDLSGKIKYLNVAKIREDDKAWEYMKRKYDVEYTPALLKYSNGKLLSKTEWSPEEGISISIVQKWLTENI